MSNITEEPRDSYLSITQIITAHNGLYANVLAAANCSFDDTINDVIPESNSGL